MIKINSGILLAIGTSILVNGCGNKVDGNYQLDVASIKATPEFRERNAKNNGVDEIALQMLSQLAPSLSIEKGKFRILTLDCTLNSGQTQADCIDQADSKNNKSIALTISEGILTLRDKNTYPLIYKSGGISSPSKPIDGSAGKPAEITEAKTATEPLAPSSKPYEKLNGVWVFSMKKSQDFLDSQNIGEIEKAVISSALASAALATSTSAGMKIVNGHLQDGSDFCQIEEVSDADGFLTCVFQSNRAIHSRIKLDSTGHLIMKTAGSPQIVFVWERKN